MNLPAHYTAKCRPLQRNSDHTISYFIRWLDITGGDVQRNALNSLKPCLLRPFVTIGGEIYATGGLTEEIARMEKLLAALEACTANADRDGFRLIENPFFLKLCPRIVFNPDDVGLVPGMYLPLSYWKLLEKCPGIRGPRGGLRVTYENVGRHFDNTTFATMVAKAWVGTTPNQSSLLKDAIRQTLETGKAVAIAIKPKKEDLRSTRTEIEPGEKIEGIIQ